MASGFVEDQDRLLDEATAVVKEQAFYMKRAMDNDNLREALKHASNLICELRTSLLSPKNYYELYMQVFQEMQHLSNFFNDKSRHNRKMIDLYESVQHAGNILPRMYLLATVGASYIKSKEASAKEILKDMSELTKGVQHPIRGLFLRYYLSQMVKDKLPDTGSEYEEAGGGNIHDAFDFILTNFTESNRLWVRIQHQGPMKDKAKREKERHDLRVLVGANLVRLSQLEGMTVEFYKEVALPKLLEHVLSVKDTMSQQYLFESMIQVFPDEFHIATLEQELATYTKAQPAVDMKPVMKALMDRLSAYLVDHKDEEHALSGVDIFALFNMHLKAILERTLEPSPSGAPAATDPLVPALELQAAFMQFTLNLFAEVHHVDIILQSTTDLVEKYLSSKGERKLVGASADKIVELLSHILKTMPRECLDMDYCVKLINCLNYNTRKQVALNMVTSVLEGGGSGDAATSLKLDSIDTTNKLFEFIKPLIEDDNDGTGNEKGSEESFKQEQLQVAKLVYKIQPTLFEETDTVLDVSMEILSKMRVNFGKGTERRLIHTLPPLIYYALGLVEKKRSEAEENPSKISFKKLFQFIHKTISALNDAVPLVAIQLWLCGAVVIDKLAQDPSLDPDDNPYTPITVEFINKAWEVFEEGATDSADIRSALLQFIGTLGCLKMLPEEDYTNSATACVKNANKMIKKPLKIEIMIAASHLFGTSNKDYQDTATCLQACQKVLKLVDAQVQGDAKEVGLWVEMLNVYIYYQGKFPETFDSNFVMKILALCAEHINFAENDSDSAAAGERAKQHLEHTKKYVNGLKAADPIKYEFWQC